MTNEQLKKLQAIYSASLVFVLPKPESVFVRGSGIGEVRLAVQKLGRMLDHE